MFGTFWESRIGCMVAGGGAVWGVHLVTKDFPGMANLMIPSGPIETCGLGIIIWLHAKWRVSISNR